jgi:DNA polymerase I
MPTLALIDGHSIAYRAFFALPEDLATSSGQVTNAVYGFTRMLIKLLGDHHPDALAVAWDVGRQTFRSERYPEYKAQRTASPDTFKSQLPLMREVLDALGIVQVQREGYEADDVIASLSEQASVGGWDVLIVTGDRDAFQLVDDHRRILYTRRGISDVVVADAAYVEERYGIPPATYVQRAALCGDTSDNLPGVSGVGDKTAAKLLTQYGSLEGIFEHLQEATPKLRENLASSRDQVFLNRELMTLVRDLDLGVEPPELARKPWDRAVARDLFVSLEFHSLWEDLLAVHPGSESAIISEVLDIEGRIATGDEAAALVGDRMVLDLLDDGGVEGVVMLADETSAVIVAFDQLGALSASLSDPSVPKVAHHAKPLVRALLDRNVRLEGLTLDTALAAYLVNPASKAYDLADVASRYGGIELDSPDREKPDSGIQGAFDFSGGADLDAAARRVLAIDRTSAVLEGELESRAEIDLFRTFELPLVGVLARMEAAGILIDREYLQAMAADLRIELESLEKAIHELAGEPFNVNSTDQLAVILYQKLGLPVLKKTPGGKPSTDASVLEKLEHPLIELLLRYREIEKLRSTYVEGYLPLIRADGRIHTTFNQMAAATGRLSSEEPNLQNIPVRSETGRTIRRAFIAPEGCEFVVADYSQIELRVLAHMSGDPAMVEAFRQGLDIHTATAARVFDVAPELATSEMRRMAKVINFGLLYGMEAFGLAQRLGCSREEAKDHIEAYFDRFPDVKAYMDGVVTEARRNGFTATLFGRRRYLPELKSDNFRIRQMGERMALNAPIQGTAADIIKKAMIELEPELIDGARMLLQIHDELVIETPSELLESTAATVRRVMEQVVDLSVPLVVDLSSGATLDAAKA